MENYFLIDDFIEDIMNIVKIIKEFKEFLKGKKANIIGLLMIALGLLNENNQLVLEGLGVITLRAGIAKK